MLCQQIEMQTKEKNTGFQVSEEQRECVQNELYRVLVIILTLTGSTQDVYDIQGASAHSCFK